MNTRLTAAVALIAGSLIVGCGSGGGSASTGIPSGTDGEVVFSDALVDNRNGWADDPRVPFRADRWDWEDVPAGGGVELGPSAFSAKRVPTAVSVDVHVVMRDGAALRAVGCREHGTTSYNGGYQLGIDGRRALIRRLDRPNPATAELDVRVLARRDLRVPNHRRVELTGRCIPEGAHGLALTLLVNGKLIVQARDAHRLSQGDGPGLDAFRRPDSRGPARLSWDHFVVRKAVNG